MQEEVSSQMRSCSKTVGVSFKADLSRSFPLSFASLIETPCLALSIAVVVAVTTCTRKPSFPIPAHRPCTASPPIPESDTRASSTLNHLTRPHSAIIRCKPTALATAIAISPYRGHRDPSSQSRISFPPTSSSVLCHCHSHSSAPFS